jgi:16S rRNA (cytosine1402-N4)-methyltransferase
MSSDIESPSASGRPAESLPSGPDYHVPVLLEEVLAAFDQVPDGEVFDGTAGGGGHSEALLLAHRTRKVCAVDRDPEAIRALTLRLAPFGDRVRLIQARFDVAAEAVLQAGPTLAGALLDLGISSRQIDAPERGFTFRGEAPLDMRMEGGRGEGETAADLLNEWPEDDLSRLLRRLGEEPRSRAIARAIAERRAHAPFQTASDLVAVLDSVSRRPLLSKDKARIFQALRIQVNDELGALTRALPLLRDALRPGGIFVVLSYHSLEDREVKNEFREWSRRCVCPPELLQCQCRGVPLGETLTRSVVRPTEEEISRNPRARSARMRVWRKAA